MAGIRHNIAFLRWVLRSAPFAGGRYTTALLGELGHWRPEPIDAATRDLLLVAACLAETTNEGTRGRRPADGVLSAWRRAWLPRESAE